MAELGCAIILLGVLFSAIAVIGALRFPDLYTRAQAIGIGDTLGALLVCLGIIILAGLHLISLKVTFLLFIFFAINPTVVHAVLNAAVAAKVEPWTASKKDKRS